MVDELGIGDHCHHCGVAHPVKLGRCVVCELHVCTRCGNTQHHSAEKKVVHDECLGSMEDEGFSMIKFVK